MNFNLAEIISRLMLKNKEGSYWDFKSIWHTNNAELVRDILSLANNTEYSGERYLIFGVTDPPNCSFNEGFVSSSRKNQSNLLDLFSSLRFLGGIEPDISVESIHIQSQQVDVIKIKDKSFKPYCLQKKFADGKERVHAGTVYTRVGDKNTAKDSCAELYHIEQMWRERFGLDQSPLTRIMNYLIRPNEWICNDNNIFYYRYSPEFTLELSTNNEDSQGCWWSSFIDKITQKSPAILKYHTTLLSQKIICFFEREGITIPYPDVDYIKIGENNIEKCRKETLSFFSFTKGTMDYSLLYFLFQNSGITKLKSIRLHDYKAIQSPVKPYMKYLPFPIFCSLAEKEAFLDWISKQTNVFLNNFTHDNNFNGDLLLEQEEQFAYWAYKKYFKEWNYKESANA